MDTRKKSTIVFENLKKSVGKHLSDIVDGIPVVGGAVSTAVKIGTDTSKKTKEELAKREQCIDRMSNVLFECKKGFIINDYDKDKLFAILTKEFRDGSEEDLETIDMLLDYYMGEVMRIDSKDECVIGKKSLFLRFIDHFPYDENDIMNVMKALNHMMGEDLFENAFIGGSLKDDCEYA